VEVIKVARHGVVLPPWVAVWWDLKSLVSLGSFQRHSGLNSEAVSNSLGAYALDKRAPSERPFVHLNCDKTSHFSRPNAQFVTLPCPRCHNKSQSIHSPAHSVAAS
jgi:hypothetical protein